MKKIILTFIAGQTNAPIAMIEFDGKSFWFVNGDKEEVTPSEIIELYRRYIDKSSRVEVIEKGDYTYMQRIYRDLGELYRDKPLVQFFRLCNL